jgi:26S proteasome regulatory subunit N4
MQAFARVDAVAANSPAQAAGLKEEDLIVTFGPLHSQNHDHLKAIAEYVLGVAAEQKSIELCVLRRSGHSANNEDRWETLKLNLTPRPWSGRGFLGCHIVPYSA